ncbi:tRNA uridine-5-carboxymethylaminomethyl(34) synthesis GTPase MnmE [Meridianimarinicoccus sp. RP-17]|uniref:tRNA uridine-5-carboxymethylaminomethyl(34) synthesis GTPase MnmE n=1 Tax=Meridianimarinicoccus zhengii TaxID=2056810 RepID=UPI000DADB827|nr:tRNA uridine-5-carboxymethylaminomethyl(34) synthesis GTPase MnmE [Phycocomes zhengii]
MDTIYALASAPGKAGVAVVRVSGTLAHRAAAALCGTVPPPRRAVLRALRDSDGGMLDKALVIVFGAGASFTGEDVAEFHLHGSRAIVAAVLRRLGEQPGLRLAEPGEFTRRALENGRLDLTEVEGLADLIASETEAQRQLALRVFDGALGRKVADWRTALIQALSLLAVTIDFSDEDVPDDLTDEVSEILDDLTTGLQAELDGLSAASRIRDGFEVAIVGPPNVGKSTLLNMLAGRDAAITSDVAGTTRDVIEVRMDLGGLPVTLLDTAGLRDTDDQVESLGIARARQRAAQADLRVFLVEGEAPPLLPPLTEDIVVQAKADVTGTGVSGTTGQGVPELLERITETLSGRAAMAGLATQERHRVALAQALDHLNRARTQILGGLAEPELLTEDLRSTVMGLDVLVGKVDVEDLLDSIFLNFCLGK